MMGRSGARGVKISFAGESLTHFGGLFLLHRFVQRLGLRQLLAERVRFAQRNNRYAISESVLAWLYPMVLGLGRIETTRVLQYNGVFQYLTGLPTYPDPQTLRRFLLRFGEAGVEPFLRLHDHLRARLQPPRSTLILDVDTSVLTVYGRQEGAAVGYNPKKRGRRSYLAWLCADGQSGEVWQASYHPGNAHASTIALPQLERAFAKLPAEVREVRVRADAAFYDGTVIRLLEDRGAQYAIVAQLTQRLKERVAGLRYTRVSPGVWAADFRYHPHGWAGPRRFIAIRRRVKEDPSYQLTLWRLGNYTYQVIVTNLPLRPLNLWRFYNGRAGAELVIRAMKEGYALGNIPTGVWKANVAYFHLVVFAYNLLHWFQRLCVPPEWAGLTLPTLRQRLLLIPAELVRPQGRAILRMPHSYPHQDIFQETLRRIARFTPH
jgi:hypothetical protein